MNGCVFTGSGQTPRYETVARRWQLLRVPFVLCDPRPEQLPRRADQRDLRVCKALRRMITHLNPDYAAVCWDSGLPLRRTELQPTYKEHRAEMPDYDDPPIAAHPAACRADGLA